VPAVDAQGRPTATEPITNLESLTSQLSRFSETILWSGVFSGRRRS
jgi:hypothetical protein